MRNITVFFLILCWTTITLVYAEPETTPPDWKLAYQNDFQAECDWLAYNSRLTLRNGWLHMKATAYDGLAFAPGSYPENVRFEFDAKIDTADWTSEMTPILAGNRVFGWYVGYRLSFATSRNSRCYLVGPLKETPSLKEYPDPATGEVFHFVAEKVGKRVRLWVNEQLLIELQHPEYVGGGGRDRVGMMTRIGAILIDNVRIYTAPHQQPSITWPQFSGENCPLCDSLVQAQAFSAVIEKLPQIQDAQTRISILLELLNHPSFYSEQTAVRLLVRELRDAGFDKTDSLFVSHVEKLALLTQPGISYRRRAYLAFSLLNDLPTDHPLYARVHLLTAKAAYWGAQEYHFPWYQTFADSLFQVLVRKNPENTLARMYLGEKIIWDPALTKETDAPRWAALLREYYVRALQIIEFWSTERQAADGALGGGWGDDVEILRQWNPVVSISSQNRVARDGIQRLVEGVWRFGGIDTLHGFSARISDVEHSAEPSADSQPPMLLLAPDNPIYLERNLAATRQMREVWTGIAPDGFRRFRSNTFSATDIVSRPPYAVDVPYAHRAARHASWLLARGSYPAVEKLLLEWAESWLNACLSEADGKPRGVVPAAVRFSDGKPGGYGPAWWEPNLGYGYYRWSTNNNIWMLQLLNLAYQISGEERFLEPLKICVELSQREPADESETGSVAWVIRQLNRGRRKLAREALFAREAGSQQNFHDYIRRFASPAIRFRFAGNDSDLCQTLASALGRLRYNWPLHTSEILATDRAYLPAVQDVFQAYTGAIAGWSQMTPADPAVLWDVPTPNFAALVGACSRQEIKVSLFHFEKERLRFRAQMRKLEPGEYQLTLAHDLDGDHLGDQVIKTRKIVVKNSGQWIDFEIPSRNAVVLQLKQIRLFPTKKLPASRLVLWQKNQTRWLCNLGAGLARDVRVVFSGAGEKKIKQQKIGEMKGVLDLQLEKIKLMPPPGTRKIEARWKNEVGEWQNYVLRLGE